jgi:hypothetical protein
MAKFKVYARCEVSLLVGEYEADSEEDAVEMAAQAGDEPMPVEGVPLHFCGDLYATDESGNTSTLFGDVSDFIDPLIDHMYGISAAASQDHEVTE